MLPQRGAEQQQFHATRIVACAPMRHHGKPITNACSCSVLIIMRGADSALAQMKRPWCSRRAHSDAVVASISKQVRMMRACFAKHAHYARQRRLRAGAHVQRLDRQPHRFDADHRSSSPNHALQAAAAASGQLTFTTVDPRRSSITISCDVTTGDLCTSTGTNAAFAGIALAGATLRPAIGPVPWTARSAATTQRRKRLAFKR